MTYDWRMQIATNHPSRRWHQLGFVSINILASSSDGCLRIWTALPRQVYARLLPNARSRGEAVRPFDVLTSELRPDHGPFTNMSSMNHNNLPILITTQCIYQFFAINQEYPAM